MSSPRPLPRRLGWLFGFAIALAIAIGSLMPDPPLPDAPGSDKWAHLLGYAGLACWWLRLLPQRWPTVLLAAGTFGVLIEFLQGQTSYRSQDPQDMLANLAGCLLGLLLARLLRHWLRFAER